MMDTSTPAEDSTTGNISEPHHAIWAGFFVLNYLNLWLPPIIFVLGTIGNVLSFTVYSRARMKQSAISVYVRSLAVADISVVLVWGSFNWPYTFYLMYPFIQTYTRVCKLFYFVSSLAQAMSSWILACISIERLIGILFPYIHRQIYTTRRATVSVVALIILICCYHSHSINTRGIVVDQTDNSTMCFFQTEYVTYWNILDLCVDVIIAFVIIIICNICIVIKMCQVSSRWQHNVAGRLNWAPVVTVTLLIVSFVYMLCYGPFTVMKIYVEMSQSEVSDICQFIYVFNNLLITINSAVNFLIYHMSGTTFRQELKLMLCCDSRRQTNKMGTRSQLIVLGQRNSLLTHNNMHPLL